MLFVPPSMPFMVPEAEAQSSQNYTVYVNQMRGSGVIDANDPGGCAGLTPQTCYSLSAVTINIGDSVTWINKDTTNNWYTLVGNWGGLSQGSGNDNACDGPGKLSTDMCGISGNDRTSWTHTFDQMGSYYYHDWAYQNSAQRPEGVVIVLGGSAPPPSSQLPVITTQTSGGGDTTPPVVTVPSDQTFIVTQLEYNESIPDGNGWRYPLFFAWTATSPDAVPRGSQSATAYCGPDRGWHTGQFSGDNHSSNFQLGTTIVTCTAVDAAGNEGSASFTVTVVLEEDADTTPPTVTATAYLNGTSPTGRTLHLAAIGFGDDIEVVYANIRMPDGSLFIGTWNSNGCGNMCGIQFAGNPPLNPYQMNDAYLPIPEDWESGSYDIIWESFQGGGWTTTTTATVPALADTTPTIMIATAHLNATSPTGRTLAITPEPDSAQMERFVFIIYKDGTAVTPVINWSFSNEYVGLAGDWQIPIPADWEAGTYDITWDHFDYTGQPAWEFDSSGSGTVVIPALTFDTTTPTVTATAYLNDTSSTGRTLHLAANDLCDWAGEDCSDNIYALQARILMPDDSLFTPAYGGGFWDVYPDFWIYFSKQQPNWDRAYLPIPVDWVAGSYDIIWTSNNPDFDVITAVTIPALTSDIASIEFLDSNGFLKIGVNEQHLIRVIDADADVLDELRETIEVNVFSDSDPDGVTLTLIETTTSSGIFLNNISFTLDSSEGSHLQVSVGDTVAAEYIDETLPEPYTASDNLTISATVTVVDASFDITLSNSLSVGSPRFVDAFGSLVDDVEIGQQVQIAADISNTLSVGQEFAYWIEVTGPTSDEMWITGYLEPGQSMSPALSWTPYIGGDYTFSIKIIDSMDGDRNSLAAPLTLQINIPVPEILIPSWIKNNAGWWASNQIDDRSFVSGLQWLISNGIMNIPPTVQGAGSDDVIPSWIKNNAGWWADDLIDDRNFVTGLQWLITNGIMIIELE